MSARDHIHRLADEELIELVQAADPRAFELLYDRHGAAAYSLAYRMMGDRMAAEDISQEAFLAIWRGRAPYQPARGSVRTWILGIVHNRAVDALRRHMAHEKRRSTVEGIENLKEAAERTDVEAARREEARSLRHALDALPREQSKVIELAYFAGFTHSQIADMLGMSIGTVKGRMRLGLEKMRRELAEGAA
jgi:RNA polymerase sigma-70 factor (ECF subfamily)